MGGTKRHGGPATIHTVGAGALVGRCAALAGPLPTEFQSFISELELGSRPGLAQRLSATVPSLDQYGNLGTVQQGPSDLLRGQNTR